MFVTAVCVLFLIKIRRCFDHTLTISVVIGTKRNVIKYDIFTCEDIMASHVRISYRFYQFVTTRYTTDFYIIKLMLMTTAFEETKMMKKLTMFDRCPSTSMMFAALV